MVEFTIKQKDIEKLNKIYDYLAKGVTTTFDYCLEQGIRPVQKKNKNTTNYIKTKIETYKNDTPQTKGEKIENDFIDLGHFCGGTIGAFIIPISYLISPELKFDSLMEFNLFCISCLPTLYVGEIPGAYIGKKLAYLPKMTTDNILTPTYDIITDKLISAKNTTYAIIKDNIEIKIE
ncbi:MAG: hypothetical protein KAI18_04415 [Candidatus Aenigmarchaeota archaeon]|nr:hypothetical protein [Candidatus Aenigmarchaeota archaeon]